jgi:hypothetical protein
MRNEVVTFSCDMDGATPAETMRFGLDGQEYDIDLCTRDKIELTAMAGGYIEVARRAGTTRLKGGPRSPEARQRSRDIRAWARRHGLEPGDRGRIPARIVARYEAGHK